MPHTRLWLQCQNAEDAWVFDQQVLKFWGMREVVYNAMDLHGEVPTVKISFVVCEVRRPMLSMAMLEDKGFHLTVGDGCRKLGGHDREMILRRKGNSYLVDVEFKDGLLGCEESMLRGPLHKVVHVLVERAEKLHLFAPVVVGKSQ